MRSVRGIMLEQARLSRERARFYRQLSRTLSGNRSAPELEKCASDLEERARAMEDYARVSSIPRADGKPAPEFDEARMQEMSGGVNLLRQALELAFADGEQTA